MGATIWGYRTERLPPESKHFTAPEVPEWAGVTLTLRPPGGVEATRQAMLKAELVVKHIKGLRYPNGELVMGPDKEPVQLPVPVKCQDGEKRTPDEFAIERYAKMAACWADPATPCPGIGEVIGWEVVLYETWFEIANWIEDVYNKRPPVKGGSTPPSSVASSDDTASTPSSPPGETPCSAPSNGHSGDSLEGSTRTEEPAAA